jgi:hypothetical protein
MTDCATKRKHMPTGVPSLLNTTTTTPLNAGATYTGSAERYDSPDVIVSCKTDQNGKLYIDFSNDLVNWDTFPSTGFDVTAGVHEFHTAVKGPRWFRVRFTNTSASNQTYLRLYSYFDDARQINVPANAQLTSDVDAIVTRPLDFNLTVAESLFQNRAIFTKGGITPTLASGVLTQDLWSVLGAYTGFPVGVIQNGMAVSTNAGDTGTLYFAYLPTETSTDYLFGSVTLNGVTPVSLGVNIWRCNFAYYDSGNDTTFNLGTISIYHQVTVANVFVTIPIGLSESQCCAYTVPYGSSAYIDRDNGNMRGSATGSLDGYLYYREYGLSPRLRFPFELQYGGLFFDDVDYLRKIPQQTDIIPRITNASANNLVGKFVFRFMLVKNS